MGDVTANGLRFHVQRLGGGERTVVFVHGLVMDNLSSWYFTVATRAAAGADVICYDLRGHGRSERPATGYTLDDMVRDLDALLDALEVRAPVQIVGNSFGGLLALAFAAAHPARVSALALVDPHVSDWSEAMAATLELEGEERDRMIVERFQSWLGRHSDRKRTRLARGAQALVTETSLVADIRASRALTDRDLAGIRCPVLAIYGRSSDLLERGEALSRLLPRCELRVLDGCSHSVLWEATAEVREHVVGWLRSAAP